MYSYDIFLRNQYFSVLNGWTTFNLSVLYKEAEDCAREKLSKEEFSRLMKSFTKYVPLSEEAEALLEIFESRFATIFYAYAGKAGVA